MLMCLVCVNVICGHVQINYFDSFILTLRFVTDVVLLSIVVLMENKIHFINPALLLLEVFLIYSMFLSCNR